MLGISSKVNALLARRPVCAILLGVTLLGLLGSVARSNASPSPAPLKKTATPVFVGPPGWQHTKGGSDGMGTWLRSGDNGYTENIVVESKAEFASLDTLYRAEKAYISTFPDVFGYAPTDTTLCGSHPAMYMSYTYTSSTGLPITTEVVIAVFGTTAYSASYNKSISQDADAAAERSLMTLCGHASLH